MQQDPILNFDFDSAAVEALQVEDCARLRAMANVPENFDKETVDDAVKRVYFALDYPAPKVVHSGSPLSLVYMQAIVQCNLGLDAVEKLWVPAAWFSFDGTEREITEFREKLLSDLSAQLTPDERAELSVGRAYLLNAKQHVASKIFNARMAMIERFDSALAPYRLEDKLMRLTRNYRALFTTAERDEFSSQTKVTLVRTIARQVSYVREELLERIRGIISTPRFRDVVPIHQYIQGRGLQREFVQAVVSAAVLVGVARESYGQLPFFDFLSRTIGFPISVDDRRLLDALLNLYRVAPFFLFDEGVCFVCDPPTHREVDNDGRLHSESGPALAYSDGTKAYYWHGAMVPRSVIEEPEFISMDAIFKETNTEVRRVMMERFGMSRFLEEANAPMIHEDEFGKLYRKTFTDDEPLVMVRVKNSTPEPDGTIREYFLRVPPHIATAREAVAWTFNLRSWDYAPNMET